VNVSCPECKTVFRVDPDKVPVPGVRARCSVCSAVFRVERDRIEAKAPAPAPPPVTPVSARPQVTVTIPEPPRVAVSPPPPAAPPALPETTSPPFRPAGPPEPAVGPPRAPLEPAHPGGFAPRPTAPATAPPSRPLNPFLAQDPIAKARRLARALVSDIVVYNPAKRRDGLRDGSLKTLFEEEIRKSWEEYVDQVGRELANSTTFFTDALNEILADGQRVFT
jgi:predicted Zn finger-like uncharacterized protein